MHGAVYSCAPSAVQAMPATHDTGSSSGHPAASMATTSSDASPSQMGPGPAAGLTPGAESQVRTAQTTIETTMSSAAPATPIGGDHGLGLHGLMNLCLAVLSGLALLVVAALLWWSVSRPGGAVGALQTQMRRTVLRPPPTAIRLAQLCVLRT